MPTREFWYSDNMIGVEWTPHLTNAELALCFNHLADILDKRVTTTHILFLIHDAGSIPMQAPTLARQAGFLNKPHLGEVVVVSTSPIARTLGNLASAITRKAIHFYATKDDALERIHNLAETV